MNRTILVLLLAVACLLTSEVYEAAAVGTAAGDSVTNGYFVTTDTVPQMSGRMSIAFVSINQMSDTVYKGSPATVARTVDTAYDLAALNLPADKNARALDTVSYAYGITNRGNATLTIDLAAIFSNPGIGIDWGAGAYKVFNDADNNGLWNSGDVAITTVTLSADASDTIVVAVLVPSTALDGDSSGTRFFTSDRAPIVAPSATGDLWQFGAPIATHDAYDTQYDTVITRIAGPNVRLVKTQVLETGRARPGDTIVYALTFDNDGGDSAVNVVMYDAISQNASFVPGTADSSELAGAGQSVSTAYDDTYSATTFNDPGTTSARVIRWTLSQPVGVTSGDDKLTTDFTGNNDAGRVYFKVRIN